MKIQQGDSLLNSNEAIEVLGLKNPGTLANWRVRKYGPPLFRVGRCVRYRFTDLQNWLNQFRVEMEGKRFETKRKASL